MANNTSQNVSIRINEIKLIKSNREEIFLKIGDCIQYKDEETNFKVLMEHRKLRTYAPIRDYIAKILGFSFYQSAINIINIKIHIEIWRNSKNVWDQMRDPLNKNVYDSIIILEDNNCPPESSIEGGSKKVNKKIKKVKSKKTRQTRKMKK
jgi:hypothetical protein